MKSRSVGESSSSQATVVSSSSQDQVSSQETIGSSLTGGGVSHGSSSSRHDGIDYNKHKIKDKGKGKAADNLTIRNPSQAVVISNSQTSSDAVGEVVGAVGAGSNSRRSEQRRKEGDARRAERAQQNHARSMTSGVGPGSPATTLSSQPHSSSSDHANNRKRDVDGELKPSGAS